jgi:hypothetical protein
MLNCLSLARWDLAGLPITRTGFSYCWADRYRRKNLKSEGACGTVLAWLGGYSKSLNSKLSKLIGISHLGLCSTYLLEEKLHLVFVFGKNKNLYYFPTPT